MDNITLGQYYKDKSYFDGVSMIRLVYNGGYWDYTHWKASGQNLFFFDENYKVGHVLCTTDPLQIVDDTHAIFAPGDHNIGLELFYGGAIL